LRRSVRRRRTRNVWQGQRRTRSAVRSASGGTLTAHRRRARTTFGGPEHAGIFLIRAVDDPRWAYRRVRDLT
jgi:hypothetical protein